MQALAAVGLGVYVAHSVFGFQGGLSSGVFEDWLYNALLVGAAALCLLRAALVAEERATWLFFGAALMSWSAGVIIFTWGPGLGEAGFPALPDWFWLGFYPAAYAGLVLLVRARTRRFYASLWLDGLVGALAAAAWVAALLFPALLGGTSGGGSSVLADLSYPVADVVMLGFALWAVALTGWRPGRVLGVVAWALVLGALVDSFSLWWAASGHASGRTAFDWLWPASALLLARAAWLPSRPSPVISLSGLRPLLAPVLFAISTLGLLLYGRIQPLDATAFALAEATLAAVVVRMALTFAENLRMAERSRSEALTDALTGLGNRRCLLNELEESLQAASAHTPVGLLLFDLDGFKIYNDTFGHPAGDALLARLGNNLNGSMRPFGRAYRLGGDEFAVLVHRHTADVDRIAAAAVAALSERGRGFVVTTSWGAVSLPVEAEDITTALQLVDRRLYANKDTRRAGQGQQTSEVLKQVLKEREPELLEHHEGVAALARTVGRRLGLISDELDVLTRAAELHDIGKIAVPDSMLHKPGPLDELEWTIMHQHTMVGERILLAAPALRPVAKLVRATHENYDGSGYPDHLLADAIPLGARIIAVCDAYDAMTTNRSYRSAMSPERALATLRACAGRQFDPFVVEAFRDELAAGLTGASTPAAAEPFPERELA